MSKTAILNISAVVLLAIVMAFSLAKNNLRHEVYRAERQVELLVGQLENSERERKLLIEQLENSERERKLFHQTGSAINTLLANCVQEADDHRAEVRARTAEAVDYGLALAAENAANVKAAEQALAQAEKPWHKRASGWTADTAVSAWSWTKGSASSAVSTVRGWL